jgi:pilus assembly protein CpaE
MDKPELDTPSVIAINASPDVAERLEQVIAERAPGNRLLKCNSYISAAKRPFFLAAVKASATSIAFIDFDKSVEQATESAQYLVQTFPGKITVVALTNSRDSGNILNAMRAGCSEFLTLPLQNGAISEIFERLEKRWSSTCSTQSRAGSLLTFLGVRGGVGSTALATHLAVYLAYYHHKRTLLIDNHSELGHVSIYLGVNGHSCLLQEVVKNVDRLDSELLHGFLAQHASGLNVLTSPDTCGNSEVMDGEALSKTIDFLRGEFDYVIADCDIKSEERSMPLISPSQFIYMVTTPEVGAIRDLSRYIDRFAMLDSTVDRLRLVLNRISHSDAIQVEEIEKATKLSIAVHIPDGCQEFKRACNLGEPLYFDPKSALANKLSQWATQLTGTPPDFGGDRKGRGLFSFWKSTSSEAFAKKGFA